jgi:hypothetical protein
MTDNRERLRKWLAGDPYWNSPDPPPMTKDEQGMQEWLDKPQEQPIEHRPRPPASVGWAILLAPLVILLLVTGGAWAASIAAYAVVMLFWFVLGGGLKPAKPR